MMDTSFTRVWNRVKASGPVDDSAVLKGFIRDELRDAADYSGLIRKTGAPRVRKLLASLAADERRHARKLQAADYMQYGRSSIPSENQKSGDERILSALRRRYTLELEAAESYRTAAETAANETLKGLYSELSEEERKHADALCALLEQML